MDSRRLGPQRLVLLVNGRILWPRHGIVGIAPIAWIFVNYAGLRVDLPGQMLEFRYASVIVIVGVVNHGHGLEFFRVHRFMPELKRAVLQLSEPVIEELVYAPVVN